MYINNLIKYDDDSAWIFKPHYLWFIKQYRKYRLRHVIISWIIKRRSFRTHTKNQSNIQIEFSSTITLAQTLPNSRALLPLFRVQGDRTSLNPLCKSPASVAGKDSDKTGFRVMSAGRERRRRQGGEKRSKTRPYYRGAAARAWIHYGHIVTRLLHYR